MKKKFEDFKEEAMEGGRHLQEFMSRQIADIKKSVNSHLNNFSKISAIHEFKNPFEKTPTKKIKRYLYQNLKFLERSEKREE
jgi:long-chain acyl-CoA synthetase